MLIQSKRKLVIRLISDYLEISSDDCDKENSDKDDLKKNSFSNVFFEGAIYLYLFLSKC